MIFLALQVQNAQVSNKQAIIYFYNSLCFNEFDTSSKRICTKIDENFWTLLKLDHGIPLAEMSHNGSISTEIWKDKSK